MMHDLNSLAAKPIGSPELQAKADRVARTAGAPVPSDLKAEIKRIAKTWLPEGRKVRSRDEVKAAEAEFYAGQIDLEDAVEKAGGQRGHMGKAA